MFPNLAINKCVLANKQIYFICPFVMFRNPTVHISNDCFFAIIFSHFWRQSPHRVSRAAHSSARRYGDWLDTNLVYPITADSCVVVFDWCKPLLFKPFCSRVLGVLHTVSMALEGTRNLRPMLPVPYLKPIFSRLLRFRCPCYFAEIVFVSIVCHTVFPVA